ncbi:MAG TPA: hypothetical protein VGJ20_33120 [Xanthobacteraceae bacterium]|jgi:hypothetical protein
MAGDARSVVASASLGLPCPAQLPESLACYLAQFDTADRHGPSEELEAKNKLVKPESEMQCLLAMEKMMLAAPNQQISWWRPCGHFFGGPTALGSC